MKLSIKTKFVATAISAVCLLSILSVGVTVTSRHILSAQSDLRDVQQKIMQIGADRERAHTNADFLNKRADDINTILNFFVLKDRPLSFIETIEMVARRTGNKMTLNPEEIKSDPSSLLFRIAIEGTDDTVRSMIRILDSLPYDAATESLQFSRDILPETQVPSIASAKNIPARAAIAIRVKTR